MTIIHGVGFFRLTSRVQEVVTYKRNMKLTPVNLVLEAFSELRTFHPF